MGRNGAAQHGRPLRISPSSAGRFAENGGTDGQARASVIDPDRIDALAAADMIAHQVE
jgi:hypothetical protein